MDGLDSLRAENDELIKAFYTSFRQRHETNKTDQTEEKTETEMEQTFYERVMSHKTLYSLMYSPNRVDWRTLDDQIMDISTNSIDWTDKKDKFIYVWGGPGPDFNVYTEDTYGKGWAFTKEEIFAAWGEEGGVSE